MTNRENRRKSQKNIENHKKSLEIYEIIEKTLKTVGNRWKT